MLLVLLLVLVVLMVAGYPGWGYHGWGYYPSGMLGVILVVVLVFFLLGRI